MIATTLRRVRAVPLRAWPAVASVAAVAAVVEVGLRLVPLPRLARLLGVPLDLSRPAPAIPPVGRAEPWERTRQDVLATGRVMRHWPLGTTCLRHALVLGHRLRRLDPVLRIGVARVDGEVRAHAWLEIDGLVLDPDGAAGGYHVLEAVPDASAG